VAEVVERYLTVARAGLIVIGSSVNSRTLRRELIASQVSIVDLLLFRVALWWLSAIHH
jgi:hypothetical protein